MAKFELKRLKKRADLLKDVVDGVIQVQDRMTKEVVTGDSSISILDAAKIMEEKDISSVLIIDEGIPVGIVTERDLVRKVIIKGVDPKKSVENIMTSGLITARKDMEVTSAANLMIEKGIRRLPVLEDGSLVGIITATDILNLF